MVNHSAAFVRMLAVLGICAWMALPSAALAQSNAARIQSVKLTVAVDRSGPCSLAISASIEASDKATLWYLFEGPEGATFDFGAEGTSTLSFSNTAMIGKGVKLQHDIHGTFRLKAGIVGADGKKGPANYSEAVPAAYTCGNGTAIASPLENSAPAATGRLPAPHKLRGKRSAFGLRGAARKR